MNSDYSHRLAWAAGFIDGDGCFCLFRGHSSGHRAVRSVSVSAANNSVAPLEELQSLFGGRLFIARQTSAGNDHWQWHVSGAKNCRTVISQLLPYLVEKKEIAEVVLAYSVLMKDRPGRRGISPEGLEARQELIDHYEEIRS